MNNIQIPRFSHDTKGALIMLAGIILFLYATNIITIGLQTVIVLASLILIVYGFMELDGYNKVMKLVNKRK